LTDRNILVEEGGSYHANPNELILLEYYANAIVHLFANAAAPAEVVARPKAADPASPDAAAAPLRAQV
jgi:hypothetical protein